MARICPIAKPCSGCTVSPDIFPAIRLSSSVFTAAASDRSAGFRFRGVGPRDGRGQDPIGGNFATTASAEINFPVYTETLRGVVFADVGDFESQFRLGTIRSSVGAGIRLVLPFLGQTPLAIDFAVPVTKAEVTRAS